MFLILLIHGHLLLYMFSYVYEIHAYKIHVLHASTIEVDILRVFLDVNTISA